MKSTISIIIGARPGEATVYAAISRRGHRRAPASCCSSADDFPATKCAASLSPRNRSALLAELLDREHAALIQDAVRIPRARVFLDGRTLRARVDPPAASIARFELDVALWQSARSAGVDARQQVTVQSIAGRGPFRIVTSDGEFESRALVNASGRWSNLNLPPAENGIRREKWLGVKAHFAEPIVRALGGFVFF